MASGIVRCLSQDFPHFDSPRSAKCVERESKREISSSRPPLSMYESGRIVLEIPNTSVAFFGTENIGCLSEIPKPRERGIRFADYPTRVLLSITYQKSRKYYG